MLASWEIAYSTEYHTRVVQLFWIDLIIPGNTLPHFFLLSIISYCVLRFRSAKLVR